MLNFLRKPTIKGRLIAGGTKAKIDLININKHQQFVMLHMMVKQIAKGLQVDHRYVLNRLLDMEKGVIKQRKEEERQAKYGKK